MQVKSSIWSTVSVAALNPESFLFPEFRHLFKVKINYFCHSYSCGSNIILTLQVCCPSELAPSTISKSNAALLVFAKNNHQNGKDKDVELLNFFEARNCKT